LNRRPINPDAPQAVPLAQSPSRAENHGGAGHRLIGCRNRGPLLVIFMKTGEQVAWPMPQGAIAMRYLLLIYTPETVEAAMSKEEQDAYMGGYFAFTQEVRERQLLESGEALQSISTATTLRVRDGQAVITDGPFAETKEQLGGFYLLNCKDLDEAIEMAAKIPGARHGSIEIRPIQEFN
jgi:hypothetical protein